MVSPASSLNQQTDVALVSKNYVLDILILHLEFPADLAERSVYAAEAKLLGFA